MKKITKFILQFIVGVSTALTLGAGKVMALSVQEGAEAARADGMPAELIGPDGVFTKVSNIALYAVGAISVLMLMWGGLRFITSGGDSKKVTDAKNTVLYSILGLAIAFVAYAIINFVLTALNNVTVQ